MIAVNLGLRGDHVSVLSGEIVDCMSDSMACGSSPDSNRPTISSNSGPMSSPISLLMRRMSLPTDRGSFSSTDPKLDGSAMESMRASSERMVRTLDSILLSLSPLQ